MYGSYGKLHLFLMKLHSAFQYLAVVGFVLEKLFKTNWSFCVYDMNLRLTVSEHVSLAVRSRSLPTGRVTP